MKFSRISNDNTANQERQSHGLPYFFVYVPFGSPDGENIILSFTVITIRNPKQKSHSDGERTTQFRKCGNGFRHSRNTTPVYPFRKTNAFFHTFGSVKIGCFPHKKRRNLFKKSMYPFIEHQGLLHTRLNHQHHNPIVNKLYQ
jgi:hypothetical protein